MANNSQAYKGIQRGGSALIKIKGSKHLGFVHAVSTTEEIKTTVKKYKLEHPKANHVCYAYILTNGSENSSDDGEPKNSAGPPILGQIKSAGLNNTLVVVIRYFGGTKLGVPGLIQAYKSTAAEAIQNSEFEIKEPSQTIRVSFGYHCESLIKRLVSEFRAKLLDETYTSHIEYLVELKDTDEKEFKEKVQNIQDAEIID